MINFHFYPLSFDKILKRERITRITMGKMNDTRENKMNNTYNNGEND